jgi:hydrogenase maturation protease
VKQIFIGGIGNILLGDDGAGPYVAHLLESRYDFDAGVEVADLGTPALDLIDRLCGKDAVILIDSIDTDLAPGTVVLYRKAEIMRQAPAARMDPHSPALVDALYSAELFGVAPEEVLLIGIQARGFEPGCNLSAPVKASLDRSIAEVLRELDRLGAGYRCRKHPADTAVWWASEAKSEVAFGH